MEIWRVADLIIVVVKYGLDPLHGFRIFLRFWIGCVSSSGWQRWRTLDGTVEAGLEAVFAGTKNKFLLQRSCGQLDDLFTISGS